MNLETSEQTILPFHTMRNSMYVHSYNNISVTGLVSSIGHIGHGPTCYRDFYLADNTNIIFFSDTFLVDIPTFPLEAEFSPDGSLLLIDPIDAAKGAPSPFVGAPPGAYNLPLIVMLIEGR